jgi:glycosyltransferase involved in cell wall biosynthesis
MIVQFLDSRSFGGIEAHVETLARAQAAAGESVAVLLWQFYPGSQTRQRFENAGLQLKSAGGSLAALSHILREAPVSTLHTHGYKANILGRIVGRLSGVCVVSTFHAGERGAFPVNAYQTIDEWSSFLGTRIAVSQPIADAMPFAARVISNFVDVPPQDLTGKVGRSVVFAGRFSHEKGPDLFCEVAQRFAGEAQFAAYGEGAMLDDLRRDHGGHVRFFGFATDMSKVWEQAGLLLMPSRNEGLPMAALEAMARGIPVAAAAVGALPKVIEHGVDGFLFPAGDTDAATQCVREWLNMDEANKAAMCAAARRTIEHRYSSAKGMAEVFEAYGRKGAAALSISSKVQSSLGR